MFTCLKRYLVIILGIILATGLAVAPVSTVFATPPEPFQGRTYIKDEVLVSCSDFDIVENAVINWKGFTYFDKDGNPIRDQGLLIYTGTLTNSSTGKTVTDTPDPQNWKYDYATGLTTVHGLQWRIVVPGEGSVVVDAGTVTFDETTGELFVVHGPHQIAQEGLTVLCEALK